MRLTSLGEFPGAILITNDELLTYSISRTTPWLYHA